MRKIIFITIIAVLIATGPLSVFAQNLSNQTGGSTSGQTGGSTSGQTGGPSNSNTNTITLKNPLKPEINSVGAIVSEGVKIFSYVVVLFAVIVLIWVGLQFILARGNAEELKKLKLWLTWVVVGVAIVIGARIIIELVINTLSSTNLVDQNVIQSAGQAIRSQ
ncbi:MAG: hypothetical protein WCW03_00405 [Candidatus Paceibacterota bacterium]|jgi:hypothetical protein